MPHIRGKLRKKVWISTGDIVLLGLRDFQDAKCDVILRYTPEEARQLPAPEAQRVLALALAVAGKEAASKALGTGWSRGVRWRDVVVARDDVSNVKPDQIKIERTPETVTINVAYQVQTPMVGNIDALVSFDKTLKVKATNN